MKSAITAILFLVIIAGAIYIAVQFMKMASAIVESKLGLVVIFLVSLLLVSCLFMSVMGQMM